MSSGWLPKHRQLFFQIFQEGPNQGQSLNIRAIPLSRQLIVLVLELGAWFTSCLSCDAGSPTPNIDQSQTPAIEFEDDFLFLEPKVSGTTRTKILALIRISG
jgi:hypothetical protein